MFKVIVQGLQEALIYMLLTGSWSSERLAMRSCSDLLTREQELDRFHSSIRPEPGAAAGLVSTADCCNRCIRPSICAKKDMGLT